MSGWAKITKDAPPQGSDVLTGIEDPVSGRVRWPLPAVRVGERFKAKRGNEWADYEPQPTHYREMPQCVDHAVPLQSIGAQTAPPEV